VSRNRGNTGPRKATDPLLPHEEVFAQAYADGMSSTQASEKAGLRDKYEGSRLLRRPVVMRRIFELQRPYVVSWKHLLGKAQQVLDVHLSEPDGYAKELLLELKRQGKLTEKQVRAFLEVISVKPADRNTSARLVIEAMSKINPKSLTDAAAQEDEAMSRDRAIAEMLGEDRTEPVADAVAPVEAEAIEPETPGESDAYDRAIIDEITH
jgi:hypothetical protein